LDKANKKKNVVGLKRAALKVSISSARYLSTLIAIVFFGRQPTNLRHAESFETCNLYKGGDLVSASKKEPMKPLMSLYTLEAQFFFRGGEFTLSAKHPVLWVSKN
jgi:hypothetical protein